MLGYTSEELRSLTFQDITHPKDLQKDLLLFKKLIEGNEDKYQTEKRYTHKTGKTVWALLSVTIIRNVDNTPQYFISQISDISRRKKIEADSEDYLSLAIDQNKSLKDFVDIINHDLRTHVGNLEILSTFLKEDVTDIDKNENYGMMCQSIKNLNEVLLQLNNTIKDNLQTQKKLTTVNLASVVDNSFINIKALATAQHVVLINDIPNNITLNTVPAYLDSILINFISNAIKYNSPKRNSFVKISVENNQDILVLKIADNGLGIDLDKHRESLFAPKTTFHNNQGSRGIGLFITENHVLSLRGSIKVESKPDEGTTFYIQFPKK